MYLSLWLFSFVIFLTKLDSINGLSCLPCNDQKSCGPVGDCKGGIGKGVCGCCDVCNKVLGEECGGTFKIAGRCDEGLYCYIRGDPNNDVGICVNCPKCSKYRESKDKNGCTECSNVKYLNEACGMKRDICKSGLECNNGKCSLPHCPRRYDFQAICLQVVTTFCDYKCRCCTNPDSCPPNSWYQSDRDNYCISRYIYPPQL